MLEYIYICRHGFRSNWVDPSIKTGPTGMNRDPPLAAYGTEQAGKLAAFLSSPSALEPHPVPERVFSSPFYRCIETAVPTFQALSASSGAGDGTMLEHGVMEWYSTVNPDTGLHPRPSDPEHLAPLFPPNTIDMNYTSTCYPSRRGETLSQLQDRADTFIEAWTARVEEMGVKCVVVFGHAASVIALGRALTGDKELEVVAGCASASLYKRKSKSSTSASTGIIDTVLQKTGLANGSNDDQVSTCGIGEWDPVFLGRADFLDNGLERDWSFRDVVFVDGEVITDNGDRIPHPPEDAIPTGLAKGMEKYLRRGPPKPNGRIKEAILASGGKDANGSKM